MYTSNKHPRIDYVIDAYLCHYRLSHINKNRINRLTKEKILDINHCESLLTCNFCLFGKMTKSSFTGKDERANDVLSLVHIDVCEPINIGARRGYYYFIIFTNDVSRYGYVYFMKHKSELFEIFK